MRNMHYSQLSLLLPTAGVCLELRSACATGIIPNYHAYYHPQGSVWSCVAHAQQALFPIITLVITRSCVAHVQQALFPINMLVTNCRDLSGVAQRMRNKHNPLLSLLLPPAGICLELHIACATGIIPNYHSLLPSLGICLELHSACATGVIHTRTITSWEEKYSR